MNRQEITMKHNEKQKKTTIKNDETDRKKQGQMMKKRETTMTNYEKQRKNNEK